MASVAMGAGSRKGGATQTIETKTERWRELDRRHHRHPFIDPGRARREGVRIITGGGLPICATEAQLEKYPDMTRLPQCEAQRAKS